MKQVCRCANCNQIIRLYGSYRAELTKEEEIGGVKTGRTVKEVIRLCSDCCQKAGYKPRGKKE